MIDRRGILVAAAAFMGAVGPARSARRGSDARSGGKRDLEGLWSLASYTDVERPKGVPNLVMTEAEAKAYEAARRANHGMLPSKPGEVGQVESEFNDRGEGLARVRGEIRSSWIIDPPDGRIPFRPVVAARLGLDKTPPTQGLENPEERAGNERCLASQASGAPMFGAADANLFQVVQTKDDVVILTEKFHDLRIVRLTKGGSTGDVVPSLLGESVGRWEGECLVVETKGLRPGVTNRGGRFYFSDRTRVVERFTRVSSAELMYEFIVEDQTLFTQAWRGEMAFQAAQGRIFEYACHEGNYAMSGILAGARLEEREAAAAP